MNTRERLERLGITPKDEEALARGAAAIAKCTKAMVDCMKGVNLCRE